MYSLPVFKLSLENQSIQRRLSLVLIKIKQYISGIISGRSQQKQKIRKMNNSCFYDWKDFRCQILIIESKKNQIEMPYYFFKYLR